MGIVHVRYDGRSIDLSARELDLGDLSSDRDVRQAVAARLGQPVEVLNSYTLDRNPETGDVTLRPQAVFG